MEHNINSYAVVTRIVRSITLFIAKIKYTQYNTEYNKDMAGCRTIYGAMYYVNISASLWHICACPMNISDCLSSNRGWRSWISCMPCGRLLPPLTGSSWPSRDQWRHRLTDERGPCRHACTTIGFPVRRVRQNAIFIIISRPRKWLSPLTRAGSVLLLNENKAPAAIVDDEVSRTRQCQSESSYNLSSLASSGWPQATTVFNI